MEKSPGDNASQKDLLRVEKDRFLENPQVLPLKLDTVNITPLFPCQEEKQRWFRSETQVYLRFSSSFKGWSCKTRTKSKYVASKLLFFRHLPNIGETPGWRWNPMFWILRSQAVGKS